MKNKLREQSRKNRDALTYEERTKKSDQIRELLFSMQEFKKAHTILFYNTIKSEVKTDKIIKRALDHGKKVVLPVVNKEKKSLELFEIRDFKKDIVPGEFNILEPKKNWPVKKEELELVLIPGMVFDLTGHRIGEGHAYYDGFLIGLEAVPKIGLSFEVQIVNEIPAEPHDIQVNKVITEKKIIECG